MTIFWTVLLIFGVLYLIGLAVTRGGYLSTGVTLTWPWTAPRASDFSPHVPEGARVFVELNAGRWVRPVLKPQYWLGNSANPWFQSRPDMTWFVIDLPFAGPLVGFTWNGDAKYCGFKRLLLDHQEYRLWTEAPLGPDFSAITLSLRG